MPTAKEPYFLRHSEQVKGELKCYHCGTPCLKNSIAIEDKMFCCDGCRLVYEIINANGLCDYYKLDSHPGLSQIKAVRSDKYAYLDSESIAKQLFKFTDGIHTVVSLYIPGIHCSSCMWLLEHLHKVNGAISESRLNFSSKEVTIHFSRAGISLRQVVELLTTIGYEPYISLDDSGKKKTDKTDRKKIYKLGIAGFCFGNIMMMSFPEYLSGSGGIEHQYVTLFRVLNLLLSLPVFFYSGTEFFQAAWAGLRQRTLNIDAPIALALIITFSRSIYEIATGIGGGYLDSMSGIVFFMLVGRVVQERTYRSISFHRDYKAYFPIAVNRVTATGIESCDLKQLKEKDVVELHNEEIIPADSVVLKGKARIDYSFVTGESEPVVISEGEMVYAGGKQMGEELTIQILKPVAGSYLTSLWNHYAFSNNKTEQNRRVSVIHKMSNYFTYVLFGLAALTAIYWWINDPAKILPAVSAMLIVACPCALLLSATYTNGNLLRIFSNNGLFLRDACVIEQLGKIDHIVFDKTGTLTLGSNQFITAGYQLTEEEKNSVYSVVKASRHPYSQALAAHFGSRKKIELESFTEYAGQGLVASVNGKTILVGNAHLTGADINDVNKSTVYVNVDGKLASYLMIPHFRESMPELIGGLKKDYGLALLSGDNNKQFGALRSLFGEHAALHFEQKPMDKLRYIEELQIGGRSVLMMGDGLNDAGALQQSNVGITLADDINNFTPSCDAILDAKRFTSFPGLMRLARSSSRIINASFLVSIVYNIVGLFLAVQGKMNPMIAAILMPVSTLSIVLVTTGVSSLLAKRFGLLLKK